MTIPALLDMRLNGIVTNQTRSMTLDFVAYNGNIDMCLGASRGLLKAT